MKTDSGQALITLLFIIIISITIGAAAVMVASLNARSTQRLTDGTEAYYIAEGGMENALMRLLRDPAYTGETLTVGGGTTSTTVTGTSPIIITTTATFDNYIRTIQTEVSYNNGVYTVQSWKEIP